MMKNMTEREKEQNDFLQNFVKSMNGSMGLYTVDEHNRLKPTYISDSMGNMLGISKEQYLKVCERDAMECIHPEDRQRALDSILDTIHNNIPHAISFRTLNKDGKYIWLNGSYSKFADMDGKPTVRVVFTPATIQFEMQQDVIQNIPGGVCLYQWDGKKLNPLIVSEQFAVLHGADSTASKISAVDFEYVYPEDLKGYQDFIRTIIEEPGKERNYTFRFWNQKKKGYIWICVNTKDIRQSDNSLLIYATYSNVDAIKEAEEKLRRNEELLEQTCSFAGVWTFFYDLENKIVYPGKNLCKAFGLQEAEPDFPECMLKTDFIPEESAKIYREMVKRVDRGEDNFQTDIWIQYAQGEKHWLRYEWKTIEYHDEKPKLAIGYARNVDQEIALTARIQMEQERLLGGDGTLLAYIISNITQNKVVENKAFFGEKPYVLKGISMDEGNAVGCRDIADPDQKKHCLEMHNRQYLENMYGQGMTNLSIEYRRKKENGSINWEKNVLNVLRDPESGDLFLYEYCYDINKEKLLEETMLAAVNYDYERFGSINLVNDQISILEPDPATNDYQLQSFKYSDLCREYALRQVYEEDREQFLQNVLPENLSKNLEKTGAFECTHREQGKNGEIRYKQDRHAYYDREKKICLLTRSDITETVKAEEEKKEQLQRALEKERIAAKAKSDFLSRMSHELRTPLNAVNGYTDILIQDLQNGTHNAENEMMNLESIQIATKYLLNIIGDILDRQKIETGKMELVKEVIEPKDYMKNMVDMIQAEADHKSIDFIFERRSTENVLYSLDAVRLQQILLNILHNAIKFTPNGGTVKLTSEYVKKIDNRALLRFTVTDTGIGMSKTFMEEKLYQAFTQENQGITSPYEGTGIGLSISKELAKLMDGDITCESEKGKGTTFVIEIMADFAETTTVKRRRERAKVNYDLGGIKILLCEDNPMNQDMTKRLLNRMNCQVDVADDGKIGVEHFERSEVGEYAMVLMDLRMPNMDGFEATRAIRSLPRMDAQKVAIVALSANAFEEDVKASLESGMNEHLAKPVDARVLYEKIMFYSQKAV